MANRAGRIIQVVPKKYFHSSLFKNNVLNCWGSNPKLRTSPRLLGFSASIAVFGLGAQFFKNDISQRKNGPVVWNRILSEQEGDILYSVHNEDKEKVPCESPSTLFLKV
ncbi:unnamed protein product [Orchesella dallaii]|uniref:Uncharacterized protein n=1 Tax=Orchesella dallaii TaxID=48710 RepID=A0ABP1QFM3_9HEXA